MLNKILIGFVVLCAVVGVILSLYSMHVLATPQSHIVLAPTLGSMTEPTIETQPETTISQEELIRSYFQDFIYIESLSETELEEKILELEDYISFLYSFCPPSYETDKYVTIYEIISPEITKANGILNLYKQDIEIYIQAREKEKAHWQKCAEEFPIATQVWLYMKNEFGWSDIVCAGIMGNLMGECGGEWSHDLDWQDDGNKSFGLVQWTSGRRTAIFAKYGPLPTVEEQLEFMRDEMFGTNGVTKQLFEDFHLDEIMNAATPEDCAYAFAKHFERCKEIHWDERRGFARTAYEYFVG